MSRRSGPSLHGLSAAVLLPLLVLAGLAWAGNRSQRKAAWTEAREEAVTIAKSRGAWFAEELEAAVLAAPNYPDPPSPGRPSELDALLDSDDPAALLEVRDNPEAGRSPAGLPRRALAALRLRELDPAAAQASEELVAFITSVAPSILTSVALERLGVPDEVRVAWTRAEEARSLARLALPSDALGSWVARGKDRWWVQVQDEHVQFLDPERVNPLLDGLDAGLPAWAGVRVDSPSGPLLEAPDQPVLATVEVPFGPGLGLSIVADPAILELHIRRQQWWTVALLGIAVAVAAGSLGAIHRVVARERQLADLKSQFVSSVSHELRAPLGSIRLMAEALEQGKTDQPAEFHKLIAREGARLTHLIENVLDFARIKDNRKEYHFEECDLTALLRHCLDLMTPVARERDITIETDLPDLTARVDPAAIEQAVINFLDNAIKFSPEGGTVHLVLRESGDHWELAIRDHGPGIPAAEHARIFERFHRLGDELRRESQGTGIGLSIVKHVAEAHAGTVRVDSTPPDGATFTLTLPLDPCAS